MKIKLLIATISVSLLFADELAVQKKPPIKSRFTYVSGGIGLDDDYFPWGALAAGHRLQWECHGFEASLQGNTFILWFSQVRLNLLYHYYFKPYLASQFYVGAGLGPGIGIESSSHWNHHGDLFFSFSPVVDAGYEYRTRSGGIRFIDLQISSPLARLNGHGYSPLFLVSYGFGV